MRSTSLAPKFASFLLSAGFPQMLHCGSGCSMNGIESCSGTTMGHVSQPRTRKEWFDGVTKGRKTARSFCRDRKAVRGFYSALCYASAIQEHEAGLSSRLWKHIYMLGGPTVEDGPVFERLCEVRYVMNERITMNQRTGRLVKIRRVEPFEGMVGVLTRG